MNCTSISSLYFRRGASMIFLNLKVSFPTSRLCPVRAAILSQCLFIMALLAMCSRSGQHSLKSSMVFFRSKKACQSFKARGSFRHLRREAPRMVIQRWAWVSPAQTCLLAFYQKQSFQIPTPLSNLMIQMISVNITYFYIRENFSFQLGHFFFCSIPS